ncbi:hypothetical protein L596_009862 [Steinernema carpocapsae]|uniref:Uncharacterized protein n=1 Tax=Steinernema carpocapsae TaxID=34508 RepID=A0A4U5PHX0_STECR|nr:hypothetical protein L596_009862 [Steinernema carpocapsae]
MVLSDQQRRLKCQIKTKSQKGKTKQLQQPAAITLLVALLATAITVAYSPVPIFTVPLLYFWRCASANCLMQLFVQR